MGNILVGCIRCCCLDDAAHDRNSTEDLFAAARSGNARALRQIFCTGGNIWATHPVTGRTALFYACRGGHYRAARVLIRRGVIDDHEACLANTPLSRNGRNVRKLLIRYRNRRRQLAEQLLSQDEDETDAIPGGSSDDRYDGMNHRNGIPRDDYARGGGSNMDIDVDMDTGMRVSSSQRMGGDSRQGFGFEVDPVFTSASEGDLGLLRALALTGADVLAPHPVNGNTPLYYACAEGHVDVVEFLLSCGATDMDGSCAAVAPPGRDGRRIMQLLCFPPVPPTVQSPYNPPALPPQNNNSRNSGQSSSAANIETEQYFEQSEDDEEGAPLLDQSTCCICMDGASRVACVPCGHLCVCVGCSPKLLTGDRVCPICRQRVTQTLRIYNA